MPRSKHEDESTGSRDSRGPVDAVSGQTVLEAPTIAGAAKKCDALPDGMPEMKGAVSPKASTAAVILAGGSGTRFGHDGGKQLFEIFGRPMLTWSAEAFDEVPDVGLIVVVCPDEDAEMFCKLALDPYPFVTPIVMAPAGELRQESAFSGVSAVDEKFEFIAMHDGARPLVTPSLIMHAVNMLKGTVDADGVIVGHPAIDTLKLVHNGTVARTPDRSLFWEAQTPQVFRAPMLRAAHSAALAEGFVGTDDSSLVERLGGKILLVEGPRDNIKMTVPEDLGPIEAALLARLSARGERA